MPTTHADRRERLRIRLGGLDVDAALITRLVNVRYLTGFTGSHAALLLTAAGGALLATDGRYVTQAGHEAPDVELVRDRSVAAALASRAQKDGVRRLALEEHDVTLELRDTLAGAAPGVELTRLGRAVEQLRESKDEGELELLARACDISVAALSDVLHLVAVGRTERAVARDLDRLMVEHGADGPAFDTIVASGPHSAIPHHSPTDREILVGDLLKIDFGALVEGYHADCTRTFVVGAEPASWQQEIHDVVRAAQRAGRHALVPGADVRDVDAAARRVVEEAGYGDAYPHGLGHGVGLEIHEAPLIGYSSPGILQDAMPVTVEPGVYLEGRGGVRIEDTLVVRDRLRPVGTSSAAAGPARDGDALVLTRIGRDLVVLG